jgi:hypothetical protein
VALGEHAAGPRAAPGAPARHGALFASVTLRPTRPPRRPRLRAALDALPEGVLRAKGVLALGRRADAGPARRPPAGDRPLRGTAPAEALVLIGTEAVWDAAEALRPLGLSRG